MRAHTEQRQEQKVGSAHHPASGRGSQAAAFLLFVHSRLRPERERKWRSIKLVPRQSQQTKDQFSVFVLSCSSAWCLGNSYWHPSHTERHFRYIWHKCNVPFLWVAFTCRVWLSYKVAFKNILKGYLIIKEKKYTCSLLGFYFLY